MSVSIRFCLVLHNHQPVGNFDNVFEQAYRDSYQPFLELFEGYEALRLSLHTSGPLMEWLDEHHPDYLDRLAALVAAGRLEVLGGPFYEPILTMIPPGDRVGQISTYTKWLESRLGADIRGLWVPERIWEQTLVGDIRQAGIEYTLLDDFHFRSAGLTEEQLNGYYVTEDNGFVLSVFPGSERLRYLIPYRDPQETIDYLRRQAEQHPHAVAVFGDDGEKFGAWPKSHKHCYADGWLRRFFDALLAHRDWLHTVTLGEALDRVPPAGRIYLPEASYREMTEWALPTNQRTVYEEIADAMGEDPRWPQIRPFVRGGCWRNFRVKYLEANEMYSRMMMVSQRLQQIEQAGGESEHVYWARRELYRSQCNCAYWHGTFGGVYLPHLRNAVYHHLIAADNLLDKATERHGPRIEVNVEDYNFDGRQEVRLSNDKLTALIAPASGGHLYELDVRAICHNLLATLARRPETYHLRLRNNGGNAPPEKADSPKPLLLKHEGLAQRLQYDAYPRKALVDHFYDNDVSFEAVANGTAMERGDFAGGVYDARLRRNPERIQVQLVKSGNAWRIPLKITKGITAEAGSGNLKIGYVMEGLPPEAVFHFAVEFNFAGMPAGAGDRTFYQGNHRRRLGHLGTQLQLHDTDELGLLDEWLGLDVMLTASRPSGFWAFPIETVSVSEGGLEAVHQSVCVQPHWFVRGDADGRWSVTLDLSIDTSLAEARRRDVEAVAMN